MVTFKESNTAGVSKLSQSRDFTNTIVKRRDVSTGFTEREAARQGRRQLPSPGVSDADGRSALLAPAGTGVEGVVGLGRRFRGGKREHFKKLLLYL